MRLAGPLMSLSFLALLGMSACGGNAPGQDIGQSEQLQVESKNQHIDQTYVEGTCDRALDPYCPRKCPTDANAFCSATHGAGHVATAYCLWEACFEMSYGAAPGVRVTLADDQGAYPNDLIVWHPHEGTWTKPADFANYLCWLNNDVYTDPTALHGKLGKTIMEIPPSAPPHRPKCMADLTINGHVYHEHFASNWWPEVGCLVWAECSEPQ